MAEVKDKIVTVESLKAKHDYDETAYLKKTDAETIYSKKVDAETAYLKKTDTSTLILTNTNDASPTSYMSPALVVGGETTAAHLEIDANEILAKTNEITPGNLFLNDDVEDTNVRVGISKSVDIYNDGIKPRTASTKNIGDTSLPFNHMYGVNYDLYSADTDYGALRVGFTENEDGTQRPTGVLELGNNNNVDSKITMYGNGTTFTNILPNNATTGSNKVTLPLQSGTLALIKTGDYTGWGSTGTQSNPITLNLGFNANVLFVWQPNETGYPYGIFFRGSNGIYHGSDGVTKVIKTAWNGNTVSWYTEEDSTLYALSGEGGKTYNYMAI